MDLAVRRMKQEILQEARLTRDEIERCPIHIKLAGDSFLELRGEITGPPDTPYEGAVFQLDILVPMDYPFGAPVIQFATKIWHPNVSTVSGAVFPNTVKDLSFESVRASAPIRTVLRTIQALLALPESDYSQDAVVARQYKEKPEIFNLTAKYWAHVYAGGPTKIPDYESKVCQLKGLGVLEVDALATLSACDWDLERAIGRTCDPFWKRIVEHLKRISDLFYRPSRTPDYEDEEQGLNELGVSKVNGRAVLSSFNCDVEKGSNYGDGRSRMATFCHVLDKTYLIMCRYNIILCNLLRSW